MSDDRSIPRRLLSLSMPVIGLNVLTVLSLAVDTAMCGRLPNAETALTALGFATQLVFLLMVAMMGLTVGTVAIVARAHGAGDRERVDHTLLQSTWLTIGVALVVGAVGNFFAPEMMEALGASPAVRDAGVDYLRPLLGFTVFYYLNILYAAVLRGVGNTRLPFLVALASNALNVLLNYGLILGNFGLPALGVQGAAIGTVLSQAFSSGALMLLVSRGTVAGLGLKVRFVKVDRPLASELFRIGAPAALDMVVLNAAFLSIVGMLGRIHEVAVAAHGIGLRIQALAFVPGLSISQATGAMVGNALGARDPDEAKSVVRASITLSVIIMASLGGLIIAGAGPITEIFDVPAGSALSDYSVMWIRLLGYGMPIVGIHIAFVGMFRGSGATGTSLWINILGTVLFQIPLSAILGFPVGMGAFGVWLAFPLSFVLKASLGYFFYRRGRWARLGL